MDNDNLKKHSDHTSRLDSGDGERNNDPANSNSQKLTGPNAMDFDKKVSQSLLDLQDKLNNVLFTMDFYRQAVDTIIGHEVMGPMSTERQRNGLALYGDWIVSNIESIEQEIEKLRLEVEKAGKSEAEEGKNKHIRENCADYRLLQVHSG